MLLKVIENDQSCCCDLRRFDRRRTIDLLMLLITFQNIQTNKPRGL